MPRARGDGLEPELEPGYVYRSHRHVTYDATSFDRVGFAMRALRVLRPADMTVAVREGCWDLRVDAGRDWAERGAARWAIVSIPPHASRVDIVLALAELAGVEQTPYVIDTLLSTEEPA